MIGEQANRGGNAEDEDFRLRPVMAADSVQGFWSAADPAEALESNWRRLFSEAIAGFGPFEWITYTYLAWLEALAILFHRNVPHAPRYVLVHFAIGVGIAVLAQRATVSRNVAVQFARHWYPLPLYIFFFEELQGLVHAIFPGWFDRWLIQFDFNLAQVHPSVWLTQFASPTLNDAMQFAYLTYFLYLVILPGILYFEKQFSGFWTVMTASMIAYSIGYVISIFFPVEAPFFAMRSLQLPPLVGGPATSLIDFIESWGRVRGGAFPSGHVLGSFVALLGAWCYRRKLFWVFLPCFIAMCVSTIYGRYHYIADILAGILVGAVAFILAKRLMAVTGANPAER